MNRLPDPDLVRLALVLYEKRLEEGYDLTNDPNYEQWKRREEG